jgi:NAD(P)-dependent dehydrogenase (short-subunit alcohol dehydrogenase family)
MRRLDGRIIFVAGGSQGIGRATVEAIAEEGAHVITCARRGDVLAEVKQGVEAKGGSIETFVLDVNDLEKLEAAILDIKAKHGRLDGLVHNAVTAGRGDLLKDTSYEEWRRQMLGSLDAYFISNRTAMRIMHEQRQGAIVNLCSAVSYLPLVKMATYSIAKAGVLQLTRAMAAEGGPFNVRVNGVAPGFLAGEGQESWDNDQLRQIAHYTPMRRLGRPRDGANAIVFLLSDEASYISGACLPVDAAKTAELFVPGFRADE